MMAPAQEATPQALRGALGRFATGVTVVTCGAADGSRVGLTVNSFNALSLQPPLVLWSLREASQNLLHFRAASHFAVNILAHDQSAIAQRFASPVADRFALGTWQAGQGGAPILAGAAAVLECTTHSLQTEGDHVLFIGRVLTARYHLVPPLIYQGGHYHAPGPLLGD